jgi:hypothetical protein
MCDPRTALEAWYRRFAEEEARGRSPLYEALAAGIAGDPDVITFLLALPVEKRQPNLLLAAVRHLFGTPKDWGQFRRTLLANTDAVRAFMLIHATQTNEPARCAVLLPLLARLPQPLALVEVGAAAGLSLLPDFYVYDYGAQRVRPLGADRAAPVFACRANSMTPLPSRMPDIIWRAGLDLAPIDVTDCGHTEWLTSLVWPEQTERLARLKSALEIAARQRPHIVKADLLGEEFEALCRETPKDATLVVFHTAVLVYVANQVQRQEFGRRAMSAAHYWISNEAPRVLPEIAGGAAKTDIPGRFLMAVNGEPVAWTDPHGGAMEWIAGGQQKAARLG